MLLKLIKTETKKLKRTPIWLAFGLMPIIPALLGTLNYLNNIEILRSEWYSLWTQHTLFMSYFFLPVMIGIYCSYIMRLEENNHNWNKTLTMPVSKKTIFLAKLTCVSLMIFLSEIWICALFILSGKLIGMTAPLPVDKLIIWCLFGTLGGIVMASLQLVTSLFIKSFAFPVAIALCGGLSALFFLAKDLGHIYPYSLMAYGMNSNAPQELDRARYIPFVITCILYIAFFTLLGSNILNRKDM